MKRLAGALLVLVLALGACGAPAPTTSPALKTPPASPATRAFTVSRLTSPAGQAELLIRPAGRVRGLVVFMHGLDSDENQIVDAPQLERVGGALVKAGYAIVASDAHGDNFGNPASVRDQQLARR